MTIIQKVNSINTKDYSAMWQDSIPDVAWGTLLLFCGIVLGYYLVISSALDGSLSYIVATLVCAYLTYASFTVAHDAGHGSIFKMGSPLKPIETVLGWVASVPLLLVPYRVFQKIHDRHHAFTNDPDRDPDHYTFGDKWYQVALNCMFIPFQYHVLSVTKLRDIKIIRDTYPSSIAYFSLVIGLLATLVLSGYGTEVLCFVVIPNVIAVFVLTMFFDFIPHHPHTSRDRYHDTRIYPSKLLNGLLLGQNYHLIHHLYPRLPWYKYKEVYLRILPDLEAHDAPIEDLSVGLRPGFMKSPNARNLLNGSRSVNNVLKVARVEQLTSDAVAVTFELPEGERLQYQAGQYVTVSKWLNGEQQTRCYSLCTSPNTGELKIGIRHTAKGLVSGFMNRELEVGSELIVQGPFGDFVYPPEHVQEIDELVLIAGGSGITPVLSIMETALDEKKSKRIHLIYSCRSRDSIMFFDQIETLKAANPDRLKVTYVIQQDDVKPLGIHGRLDSATLIKLLPTQKSDSTVSINVNTAFYICGPEGLKNMVVEVLKTHDVNTHRMHVEQFVATTTEPVGEQYCVDIKLSDGRKHALNVASNQTVLEVANAEGVKLPHACGNGTCGTCKFEVVDGLVDDIPDSIPGITSEEKAIGFTLACQCKPLGKLSISEIRH